MIESKRCSKCKIEYPMSDFYPDKRSTDGKESQCKHCKKEYNAKNRELIAARKSARYYENIDEIKKKQLEYRELHREEARATSRKWREDNPEKAKENVRKYYTENKEKILTNQKQRRLDNIEFYKEKDKNYRLNNLAACKEKDRKRYWDNREKKLAYSRDNSYKYRDSSRDKQKERYYNDPQFRFVLNLKNSVRKAIKKHNKSKGSKTVEILGCDYEFFKIYFEGLFYGSMTWEHFLSGDIHIDHIIPVSSFDLTMKEQQLQCFHYSNLQPLWAKENLSKSNSYEEQDKESYIVFHDAIRAQEVIRN